MHLFDHLAELRRRILISLLTVLGFAILGFYVSGPVISFLVAPYTKSFAGGLMIGTGPAEAFLLRIKVSIFTGAICACPVLFYQAWLFIAPGLYAEERKQMLPFVASTTLLFLVGISFCYFTVFPMAMEFFHDQYQAVQITPAIRISEYLSTILMALLGFGVVFEMPVLAYFLGRLGIIDHHMLIAATRYAVVLIFIVSAILTPPDVITQFLMAGPLLLLYGVSILIVKHTGKDRSAAEVSE